MPALPRLVAGGRSAAADKLLGAVVTTSVPFAGPQPGTRWSIDHTETRPRMPPSDTSLRDRLRYRFDNTLSRGSIAVIAWLSLLSLLLVLAAALVVALLAVPQDPADPASRMGFGEAAWHTLMRAIDAGNVAADEGWLLRLLMLAVTMGGIFIVSALIGAISSGLDGRLAELRKGHSRVIERNHILILGWNSKITTLISELVRANANQRKPCVVILAERDKVEMEDELRAKLPDTKGLRLVCRSGDPLDLDNLDVVEPNGARAIIVLSPESDRPDMHVIKTVLAITNHPRRRSAPFHLVAEVREQRNLEAARLAGRGELLCVHADDIIARVTAQTCRQIGLSAVYTELLSFDGSEFYFRSADSLVGQTYRQALSTYPDAAVAGVARADGRVELAPTMDTVLAAGEQLIVIAEDDDAGMKAQTPRAADAAAIAGRIEPVPRPERTLILGWSHKLRTVVAELDQYVAVGSELVQMSEPELDPAEVRALSARLRRHTLTVLCGDITSRADLEAADATGFDHVIVLSDPMRPVQEADAQTLITLLHLRRMVETSGRHLSIVSEMQDLRNRALAEVARTDDFIVSDQLISLLLAQLAEDRRLEPVFRSLFDADGAEVYIRPAAQYVRLDHEVDFYTLVESAAQRGETAIGYRRVNPARAGGSGVRLNPRKDERVRLGGGDSVIVLAHH